MAKAIHEKYWNFDEKISAGPTKEEKHSFLWWSWTDFIEPTKYKYKEKSNLLDEVNKFIADNEIDEILEFKNTARTVIVMDYDVDYEERRGGIYLSWVK
jgi:hypothetical protein